MIVGLISDTHGLLRDTALRALQGSELIIHAGDVGKGTILEQLEKIAPIVAVRGNIDTEEWALWLPVTTVAQAGEKKIYVLHDVNTLQINPRAVGYAMVVSGHSHKPGQSTQDGVLYVNPGSAGPRRFRLPICVARLDSNSNPWQVEFIDVG
ncbi:MAG TPA: metallophosphoesterase family protein [Candidatus Acidoferrum sp.]